MRFLATHELPDQQPEFAYDDLTVGQTFPPHRYTLARADVLQYAEATQDDNPIYVDDAAARRAGLRAVVAPPTITGIVGLLKAALGRRWPDSTLHLRQAFDFYDYPPADEPLALRVSVGTKEERKGRRYLVLVGETSDAAGRLLVRTRSTLLYGWRAPAPGAQESASAAAREGGGPGQEVARGELPPLERAITQDTITRYALASGGRAGIHLDPAYARSVGLPSTVAHGLMVATYLDQVLARGLGPAWHHAGVLEVTFLAPIRPGDTITAHARREADDGGAVPFAVWCANQRGERVHVGRATCRVGD